MGNDQRKKLKRKATKFELLFALANVILLAIAAWGYCVEYGHTMDEFTDWLMIPTTLLGIYAAWKISRNSKA